MARPDVGVRLGWIRDRAAIATSCAESLKNSSPKNVWLRSDLVGSLEDSKAIFDKRRVTKRNHQPVRRSQGAMNSEGWHLDVCARCRRGMRSVPYA